MRDLIDSTLIGSLASFLPFWIWDSRADQITGAIALSGAIYIFRRWNIWRRMGERDETDKKEPKRII